MVNQIDMLSTYYRKAQLPVGLQLDPPFELKPEVLKIQDEIRNGSSSNIILFYGLRPGKTTSAAELLKVWLEGRRNVIENGLPGYFVSVNQLCYQNRTVDRYVRDEDLQSTIRNACRTDFLVLDGIFSYLTQNDDLLLQSIYDARQHSRKYTVVTTSIVDPLNCSGSILYRIFRDAKVKVEF